MTAPIPTPALELARADFADLFDRIRSTAVRRERERILPRDEIRALAEAGFGALRVPVEKGGRGLSLADSFELLTDLAAADSNVAHAWRGHVAYVERVLADPDESWRERWLPRFAAGQLVGNAASERAAAPGIAASLTRTGDDLLVTGTKYYSTGSIYADWINLDALLDGHRQHVVIPADHPGVERIDDWDGFGQRLTGSGTTVVRDVPVDGNVLEPADWTSLYAGFIGGVFQAVLLAVAAGIGRAALADAVAFVRPRMRTFGRDEEVVPREEPLVQERVGAIAAQAYGAEAIVRDVVRRLDGIASRIAAGDRPDADEAGRTAIVVFQAQQVVLPSVLAATTDLFEVGGASATGSALALDRHWRNARTVASHNPAVYRRRAVGDFHLNGRIAV